MRTFAVSAGRAAETRPEQGAAGLRELPQQLATLAAEWALVRAGAPFTDARASLVLPVERSDGRRFVLKLAPDCDSVRHEAAALTHWAGEGAVRLEAVDLGRGALLLERAVPGAPLATLCARDDRAATVAAAAVVAQLRSVSRDTSSSLPALASWTACLESPIVSALPELASSCNTARAVATKLDRDSCQSSVLHGDLHHHNLLSAGRASWLAADPKGLTGPPVAEPAALLRNPRGFVLAQHNPTGLLSDRLAILSEHLGDDRRQLVAWAYVLAVVAAVWAWEDQEGEDEVRRWLACAGVLHATARMHGAV